MIEPVVIRRPREPGVPLVLDSPHSGNCFPADFGAAVSERDLRGGEDCYIDELFGGAVEHGAPLLAARFPRTYIDPNRHPGDVDPDLFEAFSADQWSWGYQPSGKARIGKSLVWRTLDDGRPIYARQLPMDEVRRRIELFHAPYHAALRELLDAAYARHDRVYHINCHSMKAVASKQSTDGEGTRRPDFVLGDRDGTTCDGRFTECVRESLVARGYAVTVNDPYKGVELVRAYADPAAGRHSLQIEVNRSLYMNEATYEKHDGFADLKADLTRMLERVVETFAR